MKTFFFALVVGSFSALASAHQLSYLTLEHAFSSQLDCEEAIGAARPKFLAIARLTEALGFCAEHEARPGDYYLVFATREAIDPNLTSSEIALGPQTPEEVKWEVDREVTRFAPGDGVVRKHMEPRVFKKIKWQPVVVTSKTECLKLLPGFINATDYRDSTVLASCEKGAKDEYLFIITTLHKIWKRL